MKARKDRWLSLPQRRRKIALTTETSGVAAVEFALISPILLVLLFGLLTYGNYYYVAHVVQQLANDGARAALAGLTAQERKDLAQQMVTAAGQAGTIDVKRITVETRDQAQFVQVSVRYDASNATLFKMQIVPLPSAIISRSASVKMGGL